MSVSRRQFLRGVAGAAVAGPLAARRLLSQNRTIRHASVGAAGQALSDIRAFATHPASPSPRSRTWTSHEPSR